MIGIYIASLLWIIASIIVFLFYYIGASEKKMFSALNSSSKVLTAMPTFSMTNLPCITELVENYFSEVFFWEAFLTDTEGRYAGYSCPKISDYLTFDSLSKDLDLRYRQCIVLLFFISAASIGTCVAVPLVFLSSPYLLPISLGLGLLTMLIPLAFLLIIVIIHRHRVYRLKDSYTRFVRLVDSRLVSSDSQNNTALIIRSGHDTVKALEDNLAKLTYRLDSFATDTVVPEITKTFDKSFTASVTPTLKKLSEDLNNTITKLFADTTDTLSKNLESMSKTSEAMNLALAANNSSLLFLKESQGGNEQIKESINQLSDLLTKILSEGDELIKRLEVTSSDITSASTAMAENSSEFDDNMKNALYDMNVSLTAIINTLSDEAANMNREFGSQTVSAMEAFQSSISALLESFEYQTRDIGLFTKELNFEIGELTAGLNGSVDTFSSSLNKQVDETMLNFDQGLAQLVLRITNTAEAIQDALDNLPRAINSINGGD